jgi:DNA-binding MarR family transcriptional regulator
MRKPPTRAAPSLHVTAFRAFVRAFGLFRNVMTPYFAQFGLSGSQWGVLRALDRAEAEGHGRLRLTDLGRRLLVRTPSVSGVVDRLQRQGLVTRMRATRDRREKRVVLTRSGRELVRRVLRRHPAQIRSVLGGLDRREVLLLRRLMERIAAHLEPLADAHDDAADDSQADEARVKRHE